MESNKEIVYDVCGHATPFSGSTLMANEMNENGDMFLNIVVLDDDDRYIYIYNNALSPFTYTTHKYT